MELYEAMAGGGGERAFGRWVRKQPWRRVLPTEYFQLLGNCEMRRSKMIS